MVEIDQHSEADHLKAEVENKQNSSGNTMRLIMSIGVLLGLASWLGQLIDHRKAILGQAPGEAIYDIGYYFASRMGLALVIAMFFVLLVFACKPFVKKGQFTIRGILIFTLCAAIVVGGVTAIGRQVRTQMRVGLVSHTEDWPHACKQLLKDDPTQSQSVSVYQLSSFIDYRSIWRIKMNRKLVDQLVAANSCIPTTFQHPKATALLRSLPYSWRNPDLDNSDWYATPGYGSQYLEGVDLFLIVVDRETGDAYALHELIF